MDDQGFIPMGDEENPFTIITKLFDNANLKKITDLTDRQIAEMTKLYFFTLIEDDQFNATEIIRKTLDYYTELTISRDRKGRTEIKEIMKGQMEQFLQKEDKSLGSMIGGK